MIITGKMLFAAFKIITASIIICFTSWLSGKNPVLAGFVVGLPLITMMALPFGYAEYPDAENSIRFAKSIFTSTILTILFFIPFLLGSKLNLGFWPMYLSGAFLLTGGYFIHKWIMSVI
jgi:hypothetical protein